jgi:hypothetical protein
MSRQNPISQWNLLGWEGEISGGEGADRGGKRQLTAGEVGQFQVWKGASEAPTPLQQSAISFIWVKSPITILVTRLSPFPGDSTLRWSGVGASLAPFPT